MNALLLYHDLKARGVILEADGNQLLEMLQPANSQAGQGSLRRVQAHTPQVPLRQRGAARRRPPLRRQAEPPPRLHLSV